MKDKEREVKGRGRSRRRKGWNKEEKEEGGGKQVKIITVMFSELWISRFCLIFLCCANAA